MAQGEHIASDEDEGVFEAVAADLPVRSNHDLIVGLTLLPEQKLASFSPEQFELLAGAWVRLKAGDECEDVRRYAGAGDMGRDIVALFGNGVWDNYQCKRVSRNLGMPAVVLEIGKILYWIQQKKFSQPRNYTFVALKSYTAEVSDLFNEPREQLCDKVIELWDQYCAKGITTTADVPLTGDLKTFVQAFDFAKFHLATSETVIADLRADDYLFARFFGGGLSLPAPVEKIPPAQIQANETGYVTALLGAYQDHAGQAITTVDDAGGFPEYADHLSRSRRYFYCAEAVREIEKDNLPPEYSFRVIQDGMHDGVIGVERREHESGYHRVQEVTQEATKVALKRDHPMEPHMGSAERMGVCHQLAGDEKLKWVQP